MPITYNTESPDSIEALIKKINAIITVNKENINFINSRKGKKVIIKNHYTLSVKQPSPKKRKVDHEDQQSKKPNDEDEPLYDLINDQVTIEVDDVIKNWKYQGFNPLKRETIAFDQFLNLQLRSYKDLLRLNQNFAKLSEKNGRILTGQPESVKAVRGLLSNVETLQVAIGEVHAKVLDVNNPLEGNEKVSQVIRNMSRDLKVLQEELPQVKVKSISMADVFPDENRSMVPSFHDMTGTSCKATLQPDDDFEVAVLEFTKHNVMQDYVLNKKHCLAAAYSKTVNLWDLETNTIIGTLTGHTGDIHALTIFSDNGTPRLVSGAADSKINIWNLQTRAVIKTLCDHKFPVYSLAVTNMHDKTMLISGGEDYIIRVYDLQNYSIIAEIDNEGIEITALLVYQLYDEYYLASASRTIITLWNLNDYSLFTTLKGNYINSLKFIKHNDHHMLASLESHGVIRLWNLENNTSLGSLRCISGFKDSLCQDVEVIIINNEPYLVAVGEENKLEMWNLCSMTKTTLVTPYSPKSYPIYSLKAFMNRNKACIACANLKGTVKLWME